MIGWRVGWVVGPSGIVPDISRVSISNVVCQIGIGMPGAAAALDAADDGITASVSEWQRRRDVILDELAGLPVIRPNGGWSLLLEVRQLGFSSREASKALLAQGEIVATAMVNGARREPTTTSASSSPTSRLSVCAACAGAWRRRCNCERRKSCVGY